MAEECEKSAGAGADVGGTGEARAQAHGRRLDLIGFGVVTLAITLTWLPTLASGGRISSNDDFLLHAARHEAVRKSVLE
ncbi:MAG: hypothetical protein PVH68_09245, partial [Armatimonadota bacterium]